MRFHDGAAVVLPAHEYEVSKGALTAVRGNMQASVEANRPTGSKGIYWKSLYVCSTMGPSVQINVADMKQEAK